MFSSTKPDDPFLTAFVAHADKIVTAATALREMLDDLERSVELSKRIKEVEHEGDQITHETIARLHKQWITPLDRGDIHALITSLDDVLDMIEAVAERLVLFEITTAPHIARESANVIYKSAVAIQQALSLLSNLKKPQQILDLCIAINSFENQADSLYRTAIAELFKPGNDPLHVMKWREIYDKLEAATDRSEDVANVLEGIVLEYS